MTRLRPDRPAARPAFDAGGRFAVFFAAADEARFGAARSGGSAAVFLAAAVFFAAPAGLFVAAALFFVFLVGI
jgi:hypothetical protein